MCVVTEFMKSRSWVMMIISFRQARRNCVPPVPATVQILNTAPEAHVASLLRCWALRIAEDWPSGIARAEAVADLRHRLARVERKLAGSVRPTGARDVAGQQA